MKYILLMALIAMGCSKSKQSAQAPDSIFDDIVQFEALSVNTNTQGIIPNSALDFASLIYKQSGTQSILITNQSPSPIVFTQQDFNSSMLAPFEITSNSCIGSIAFRKKCSIEFKLSNPTVLLTEQIISSALVIKEVTTISLTGILQAAPPQEENVPLTNISVSPSNLDFGTLIDGRAVEMSLIVKNNGNQTSPISLSQLSSSKITVSSNTCLATLGSRKSCSIKLKYIGAGNESITAQPLLSVSNNPVTYSVVVDNPTVENPVIIISVQPLTSPITISRTRPSQFTGSLSFKNEGTNTFAGPISAISSDSSITISSVSCLGGISRGKTCSVFFTINSAMAPLGESVQSIKLQSGTTASAASFINLNIQASGSAPVVSFSPIYSAFVCGAAPCSVSGTSSRTLIACQKLEDGAPVVGGTLVECSSFNIPANLESTCSAPAGQKNVSVMISSQIVGSKQVSCPVGSSVESYVANSISCNSGYSISGNTCIESIVLPTDSFALFGAEAGGSGRELFKINDQNEVSQFSSGFTTKNKGSSPLNIITVGSDLYYLAHTVGTSGERELYKLASGTTTPVKLTSGNTGFGGVANYGDKLFYSRSTSPGSFGTDYNCYSYNTITGVETQIYTGSSCNFLPYSSGVLVDIGVSLHLVSSDGLSISASIFTGNASNYSAFTTAANGKVYFIGSTSVVGREIFEFNPATSTVSVTKDVTVGVASTTFNGNYLLAIDNNLFYVTGSGSSGKMFKLNLTTLVATEIISTQALSILNNAYIGGSLYFPARTDGTDVELHRYNISSGVLTKVANIRPDGSGGAGIMIAVGTDIFYSATDGFGIGQEIFKYDTNTQTTVGIDINPGQQGSFPAKLHYINDSLYAVASSSVYGKEIFKINPATNTISVINVCQELIGATSGCPGIDSSSLFPISDGFYFIGTDQIKGTEVAKYNTTTQALTFVDTETALVGSDPGSRFYNDGKIFYSVNTDSGQKLAIQDINSPAGSQSLISLPTVYQYPDPKSFFATQQYVYFVASSTSYSDKKVYRYHKVLQTVEEISYINNNGLLSKRPIVSANGRIFIASNSGLIEYFEASNTSTIVYTSEWNPSDDQNFDLSDWQSYNCFDDGMGNVGCNEPYVMQTQSYPSLLTYFNNKIYFSATVFHYKTSNSANIESRGTEIFEFDMATSTVSRKTNLINPSDTYSGFFSAPVSLGSEGFEAMDIVASENKIFAISKYLQDSARGILSINLLGDTVVSGGLGYSQGSLNNEPQFVIDQDVMYISTQSSSSFSSTISKINIDGSYSILYDGSLVPEGLNLYDINSIAYHDGYIFAETSGVLNGNTVFGIFKLSAIDGTFNSLEPFITLPNLFPEYSGVLNFVLFKYNDNLYFSTNSSVNSSRYSMYRYDLQNPSNSELLLSDEIQVKKEGSTAIEAKTLIQE